jgi:type II secretory pathway pseudopilin PulG
MKRGQPIARAGFSLVEVVLALGIVVFCLVTIVGLLAEGIGSSDTAIEQTSLENILTAVATDLRSTPNPPAATPSLGPGTAQTSPVYGIPIPAAGTALAAPASPSFSVFLGPNGEKVASAAAARYLLSVWTSVPGENRQEIVVRLLFSWPAQAAYTQATGSVEDVMTLNRS